MNKASIDLDEETFYSSVCGNLVAFVFLHTEVIKVWDFVEDTWACFRLKSTQMFDPSHVSQALPSVP